MLTFATYIASLTSLMAVELPFDATTNVSLGALAIFGILVSVGIGLWKSVRR
jgi:hypothetical protein